MASSVPVGRRPSGASRVNVVLDPACATTPPASGSRRPSEAQPGSALMNCSPDLVPASNPGSPNLFEPGLFELPTFGAAPASVAPSFVPVSSTAHHTPSTAPASLGWMTFDSSFDFAALAPTSAPAIAFPVPVAPPLGAGLANSFAQAGQTTAPMAMPTATQMTAPSALQTLPLTPTASLQRQN